MSQPKPKVERKYISKVGLHDLFYELSEELGYEVEEIEDNYLDALANLIELWTKQGYIEVYVDSKDRKYGRCKPSDEKQNSVPWYIGVHHARLLSTMEDDPLIVIIFEELDENGEPNTIASLRFLANHDLMFGEKGRDKYNPAKLKALRMHIDSLIQEGNKYTAEQIRLNREMQESK
ncbi:hypothetical protein [Acinetobacter proteolyticus]|uniref:Uncharacterized protein n=1 Tax=Acinetobacter proteolyticus TaxID=1776741 RepID=A0A2N0WI74_9GAMM|nr:hypothetical protein [Acinetobacter proteolyticus]PKF35500.1 hypothetical protein CW311_04215 [Acinetobacter proteolyticus]